MTRSKTARPLTFQYYAIVHDGVIHKFYARDNQGNARRNMVAHPDYRKFGFKVSKDSYGNDAVNVTGFKSEETGFFLQLTAGRMPHVNADELCFLMHNILDDYLAAMAEKGAEI